MKWIMWTILTILTIAGMHNSGVGITKLIINKEVVYLARIPITSLNSKFLWYSLCNRRDVTIRMITDNIVNLQVVFINQSNSSYIYITP